MFELICMSILGIAYIDAFVKEEIEEKAQKEKERINEIKILVFCFAIRHHLNYDNVVKMLQNKTLKFEDIRKDRYEHK